MAHMSSSSADFPYPLLPPGEDAVRILTLKPGGFDDPIISILAPIAFSAKPKYTALSYTWGDSYLDSAAIPTTPRSENSTQPPDARVPEQLYNNSGPIMNNESNYITVNTYHFPVKHNLSLALRHLRSPTYPLAVWIDAICIDQKNTDELNTHVAMMSFIYRRALMVVAWLGVKEYKADIDIFRFMGREWSSGQTRHLAEYVDGSTRRRFFSHEPDEPTFDRIATSSYWTRLWIVQEVCLSHRLIFAFGSKLWTYEELSQWTPTSFRTAKSNSLHSRDDRLLKRGLGSMMRLIETRESKHTEAMAFGNLLEVFYEADCSETRDRIYGLLGLANDVTSYSSGDNYDDPVDRYIESLDLQDEPPFGPQNGKRMFKVDYSQSFYEVWFEVMKYLYFRAKTVGGEHARRVLSTTLDSIRIGGKRERDINIVRTSGIVQKALEQKVEEERTNSSSLKEIYRNPVIRAVGYIGGQVMAIGPEYKALVSSSRSQQDWVSSFEDCYSDPNDLEILRRSDEQYMVKIIEYGDEELSRIQLIRKPGVVAWDFTKKKPQCSGSIFATEYEKMWEDKREQSQGYSAGPMMCLCTGNQIGIVPSMAKLGDVLIRFFNCNAAVIMRPFIDKDTTLFMLIGRADVAEVAYRNTGKEPIPRCDMHACKGFLGNLAPKNTNRDERKGDGGVYVDMDLDTLQAISASITVG